MVENLLYPSWDAGTPIAFPEQCPCGIPMPREEAKVPQPGRQEHDEAVHQAPHHPLASVLPCHCADEDVCAVKLQRVPRKECPPSQFVKNGGPTARMHPRSEQRASAAYAAVPAYRNVFFGRLRGKSGAVVLAVLGVVVGVPPSRGNVLASPEGLLTVCGPTSRAGLSCGSFSTPVTEKSGVVERICGISSQQSWLPRAGLVKSAPYTNATTWVSKA